MHVQPAKDVDFDLNVNVDDGSTNDPAADVARLAEIDAEIASLDTQIQAAAFNDAYELADSLDTKQQALNSEREAITTRLSEAHATAVDTKAQHEKELSVLKVQADSAAEAEDYERAAELEEKADEVGLSVWCHDSLFKEEHVWGGGFSVWTL